MFNDQDLEDLSNRSSSETLPLEFIEHEMRDFEFVSHENYVFIARGGKQTFGDIGFFWLKTVQHWYEQMDYQSWSEPNAMPLTPIDYVKSCIETPISHDQFIEYINHFCQPLQKALPFFLTPVMPANVATSGHLIPGFFALPWSKKRSSLKVNRIEGFQSGFLVKDDIQQLAIIAQTPDSFIAFHWSSTA